MSPTATFGRAERLALAGLALLAFALVQAGRVRYTLSDPQLTLLSSQALLETGRLDLRPYLDAVGPERLAKGRWKYGCDDRGRVLYAYPLGTSLLALPAVAVARTAGLDLLRWDHDERLQILLAGTACGAVLVLLARLLALWLPPRPAVGLAAAVGLGSSLISTLGSALWSFDAELVFLLLALLEAARLVRGGGPPRGARLGALLAAAWLCRPSAVACALPVLTLLAWRDRRGLARAALGAAAVLGPAVLFFHAQTGRLLPGYYAGARWLDSAAWGAWAPNLASLLLSPARGLLVFTPFLAFGLLALLVPGVRRDPLARVLAAWAGLTLAATASQGNWWGGWCFGPRLLTEAVAPLALLAACAWSQLGRTRASLALRACVAASLAWGLGVHSGVGLFRPVAYAWNDRPDIDQAPEFYRWNWRHPQFLATAGRNERKAAEPAR